LLIIVFFLATFCFSCFESTLPLVVSSNFHIDIQRDETSASTVAYLFVFCGVIGAMVQGRAIGPLVKRLGEPKLIALSLVSLRSAWRGCLSSVARLTFPGECSCDRRPVLAGHARALALLSVGTSLTRAPLFGMLSNLTSAHEQGANLGVAQAAGSLARILGPIRHYAAGLFTPPAYLICAAVLLVTTS